MTHDLGILEFYCEMDDHMKPHETWKSTQKRK
jgi:hypothetical protein